MEYADCNGWHLHESALWFFSSFLLIYNTGHDSLMQTSFQHHTLRACFLSTRSQEPLPSPFPFQINSVLQISSPILLHLVISYSFIMFLCIPHMREIIGFRSLFFCYEAHPSMVRTYFWFSVQELFLEVLGEIYVVLGSWIKVDCV